MNVIFRIFKGDLKNATSNLIGIVVLIGLSLIPALYAWFNIAGSWDPYANTDGLKVAVANSDEGYQSDLIPLPVNIGDTVESTLRANDSFDWIFTDEENAVDGVRSGEYYAAIVIPSTFSADMMTVFSDDIQHSSIVYYSNEKENAIAPHVTEKGAGTVQEQIDQTFTSTVDEIVLATTVNLAQYASGDGMERYASLLNASMHDAESTLASASAEASALADVASSCASLVSSTASITGMTNDAIDQASQSARTAEDSLENASDALTTAFDDMERTLTQSLAAFDAVDDAVDRAFDAAQSQPAQAAAVLRDVAAQLANTSASYQTVRDALASIDPDSPLLAELERAIARLDGLSADLDSAAQRIETSGAEASAQRQSIVDDIDAARSSAESAFSGFSANLRQHAASLSESLQNAQASSTTIAESLASAIRGLSEPTGSTAKTLDDVARSLRDVASSLDATRQELAEVTSNLDDALQSNDLERVAEIVGSNASGIASFLAAPVELQRHAVYGVENNGSAMAGFYTVLSLWVGSIILAAMMKTGLSPQRKAALGAARPHQSYFGRFGIFALLALAQATIVCLGDLFLLGIQCEHPALFVAAGWLASLVFCSIVYTLTVSFGDIGKALCVVLLVMQVAGSGGIFPIEMTAPFFQKIYPFLPFTPAIEAMHACIAGIYADEYAVAMVKLAAFLIPVLLLGLVLRKPVIRLNDFIVEKMEETRLM